MAADLVVREEVLAGASADTEADIRETADSILIFDSAWSYPRILSFRGAFSSNGQQMGLLKPHSQLPAFDSQLVLG